MKMSKPQPQLKPSPLLTRPTNIPPLSNIRPFLNHDTSFINKIFQSNNEVKQMAGKNYSKITERLPNVSSNIETIFSSDERLITAKQYINHYRNTKSTSFTKPFVFSKGNVSFRVMKDQIKNQFNAKSSTTRSTVKDDQQQQQLNTLNHSMHNYIDDETLPKESKYTFKESIDNLVFANTSKIKNKITPTNDRYTVDNDNYNYDDININIDMNKSHHSNILNSPPHRRSFNNVGNLSVSPGDIAGNEFLMKRSGLRDVCLTQRASRSSHSNGSSKRNNCSQLTRSVEIERRHKQLGDGNKGNYCINIFPLSMSVHLKMKQNEFNKKKGFNKDKEGKNKDNNSNNNVNMDLSYIYNNNSKGFSRDVSVDNEDDIVNFKTSINEREHMGMMMVNPFGKSVEEEKKSKQKIKVIRKYKKKEDDEGDVKDEDDNKYEDNDDNEKRSNCEDIIDFEFKDNEDDNEGVIYKEKDKEIRISQLIDDKNKENNNEEDDDKINYMDDHGKLSKDRENEKIEQKEMNPFLRKQQLRYKKPQNDIVDIKDDIELDQETLRRSANGKDDNDNDNECNVKNTFNNELQTGKQDVNIIEDIIDDNTYNDINVNKDHPKEDMEKINEKESVEEIESEHIQNKDDDVNENNINNSISNEQQQQHSIEHPSTISNNHEQELIQLTPQSTPKPKSQHSSSKTPKHPPSTESHSNNKHLPSSQDLPIKPNSIFLKETPTTQNLLENDTTTIQPKSQFIPPETIIPLDTPINSLTPQSYSSNITNELNEKLNSLLNALNTYDTGIFVFNIQNGKIANEQRYQNVNELYNTLRNERHNELQIKQNSFDLLCKANKDKEQLQDKESDVKGSVNKVMKLNTICSLINFTYNASPSSSCVSDLNLKTFTPRMFQSHSNKKPTHVRTYSNPVMDNKSLHFFDSDIHAVANEIAYKEISRRKQSKQLSNSCALESINKEVNAHSFKNMKVSCNEVNINKVGIKKMNNNKCQSVEGFDIKQDKAFRNVTVASNEVNVSEVTKVKRNKKNVVLNEIMFEIGGNEDDNGKVKLFKKLNVVSKEVDFKCVITRKQKDNTLQEKVFKDVQIVSQEVNVKQISQVKSEIPKDKGFKDVEIVSQEVNVKELSKNKRKIRQNKEKSIQIVSKEADIKQISKIKHNIEKVFKDIEIASNEVNVKQISNIKNPQRKEFKDMKIISKEVYVKEISQIKPVIPQEKVFKDMQIVSKEVNVKQIFKAKPKTPQEKSFKDIQIVSKETVVEQTSQPKHNNTQRKEFKDIQITSKEVNMNQISQTRHKNRKEKKLESMKIVSQEVNVMETSKNKPDNPKEKVFKDIQIVSNEVNVKQISEIKHIIPQKKEFKDIQIASNEVNVHQLSQINKKDNSTKNEPLKPLEIISNEIIFNQLSIQKDTDNKPQDKSFKDIDIIYNEITINHLSSKHNKPTLTPLPPIYESELINELTIKQQRNYNNTNIIQEDIINITHPPLYSRQLPSTFQIKSIETLTIIPNYLKESTPTLTLTLTQTEPQTFSFLHSKAFTGMDVTSNEITITHFSSPKKTNSTTNQPQLPLIIQPNNTLTFIHENSFSNIDIITNETSFNHVSQHKPLHHLLKQTQPQHFSIHLNKPSKPQQHIEITHTELNLPQQQQQYNNKSTPTYQEQSKHSFNIIPTITPTPSPLQPKNNINNFSFAISGNTPHEYKLLTIKHRHSLKFPPRNKKHVVITQQKLARFIIKPKKKKNLSIPVQNTSFECQQDKLANALKLLQQEQITSDVNYLPKHNFINNFFMKMCVAFMVITLMSHFYNKNKK